MSQQDYNQWKEDLFKQVEEIFDGLFTSLGISDEEPENEKISPEAETSCERDDQCCCSKCTCTEIDNSEKKEETKDLNKQSIADQLYAKHYNTWNYLNNFEKENVKAEEEDTMSPVIDKIIIMFKNIINGTLRPDVAEAGFDNLYYELSDEHHFDYYITFGGSFDGVGEKPYAKVGIDLEDLHDESFIKFCRDCVNNEDYLEEFANTLTTRLGFNGYDVVLDNNTISLKMYYWVA